MTSSLFSPALGLLDRMTSQCPCHEKKYPPNPEKWGSPPHDADEIPLIIEIEIDNSYKEMS